MMLYSHFVACTFDKFTCVMVRGVFIATVVCVDRQVILILTQLEGSGAYSVNHRLVHRGSSSSTLGDWGQGRSHIPDITPEVYGLHIPRPL